MKKTLDIYSVLFVYYTITKGDIMKNLTNYKIIKGKALVDYLMRFDYTRKQATMMEKRLPGGVKVQVIY